MPFDYQNPTALLITTPEKIEQWFENNKNNSSPIDSPITGKIYTTNIWNKPEKPQRIYITQNSFGIRQSIGWYNIRTHTFSYDPRDKFRRKIRDFLTDETKEALVNLVV